MQTPFDQAQKSCSQFAWNLLSSAQVLKVSGKLNMDNKEEKLMYDTLIEHHCKYLTNGDCN